jgi:Undecaprenyl-phosphate galactose phosphotransferase WbaP
MSSFAGTLALENTAVRHARATWLWTTACVVAADLVSVTALAAVAAALAYSIGLSSRVSEVAVCSGIVYPLLVCFALFGVYSPFCSAVDELQKITLSVTVAFTGLSACAIYIAPRAVVMIFLTCTLVQVFLPPIRRIVRHLLRQTGWWGFPVALIGDAELVSRCAERLKQDDSLLVPAVLARSLEQIEEDQRGCWQRSGHKLYALIAVSAGIDLSAARSILSASGNAVTRIFIQPEEFSSHAHEFKMRRCGKAVALEMNNSVSNSGTLFIKRLIDIALSGCVLLAGLPALLVIAAVIKLNSPGPIIYGHTRHGKDGRRFKAWKFRSMVQNGDDVVRAHLAENKDARQEWESNQKLRRDPRVTSIGKLLRFTSLDEVPQLVNVLRGEMSLVGPRPIVPEEVNRYGDVIKLYRRVTPGMTGLWQVSGRNNTTYQQRVELDEFYVRNWSVWLDLDILIRTVPVVMKRDGAC